MVYNQVLAERVRAALGSGLSLEEKKMFGGITYMVDGQMCCGVLKDDLIVKVDPASDALDQPGARPFDFSGKPMAGMVYVAASALGEDATLHAWVQRGVAYVRENPKGVKPKSKSRRG